MEELKIDLKNTNWDRWNEKEKRQFVDELDDRFQKLEHEKLMASNEDIEGYLELVDRLDKNEMLKERSEEFLNILDEDQLNEYIKSQVDEAIENRQSVAYAIFCLGIDNLTFYENDDMNPTYYTIDDYGKVQNITKGDLKLAYEEVLDCHNLIDNYFEEKNTTLKR